MGEEREEDRRKTRTGDERDTGEKSRGFFFFSTRPRSSLPAGFRSSLVTESLEQASLHLISCCFRLVFEKPVACPPIPSSEVLSMFASLNSLKCS